MKLAKWMTCCAVLVLFVIGPSALAQIADPFGPGPNASPQVERLPVAEKSALTPVAADAPESARDFCQCVGESESASVARIKQALRNPLKSSGLEFTDTPLEEVVAMLQEEYGIPVQIDKSALEEIGIDAQEKVSASLRGISLSAALRLMFRPLQVIYIIQNEVLMITTPEEAEAQLDVCVYDVRTITARSDDQSLKQLIDTIISCVATETWAVNGGGEAEIRPVSPGLLVISQTRAVHDEVRALLTTIRDMRQRTPTRTEPEKSTAIVPESDRVVTRAYVLQLGDASNPEALRQQIRSLITSALPDERWQGQLDDGQQVLLTILPDRIVLRHKPAIQNEVETLLTDSGVASAAPKVAGEMSGRGGYGGGYGGYGGGRGGGEGGMGGYGGRGFGYGGYGREGASSGGFGGSGLGEERGLGAEDVPQPQPADND